MMWARSSISPMIGLARFRQRAERDRKEHGEHHDLQDFVLRHRVRDRGRDQMGQELLDRERRDRQAGRLRLVGQRAGKVGAGLQQIDHDQAEQQRDKGGADEPAHRLGEHAAELGAGAHMRDTADERGEHQRRDDHLDQAQEQHGDQVYVGRDFHPAVGHIIENDGSHHNAKRHRDQDVLRKPAGHSRTPVFPATTSLADLNGDATSLRRFARLPECSRCEMRARRLAFPAAHNLCS